jgi:AraC family transcriptional regulator of arabinose operon
MADERRNDYCPPAEPIVTGHIPLSRSGLCYREDGLPGWLLMLTLKGGAYFLTPDRKRFESVTGDLVLIAPMARQEYGVDGPKPWDVVWHVFEAPAVWERWLGAWPCEGEGHYRLSLSGANVKLRDRIIRLLCETHQLATGDSPHRELLAMNALEAALIWADQANPLSRLRSTDQRVRRAVDFIRSRLSHRIGLPDIAEAAGVSLPHLSRLFRSAMKQTPMAFLESERMTRARQLLEVTPLPVQSIAWEVGFENAFYFTTRFKKLTGRSPRAWRESRTTK